MREDDEVSQEPQNEIDKLNARLWPIEAVMERLSVGRSMVFELMARGQLTSVKVGRRRLISESQINAYIARLESSAA
ncbi:helix-turn-helix domain-containing protein [Mycobacteroides abscessus]|uniref:helix-turn-helix domain-containing protein n=1 Tax=Mycobacteroides abscessus TaxID=36809 RepID=UPI001F23BBF4|nr:helix-turn-helix domain-containing protein [Mycobacteroides abscessus]